MNNDKKIQRKIGSSISPENANYVFPCIKHLEEKKQQIYDYIYDDYLTLNSLIYMVSLATTLQYRFTKDGLLFCSQNNVDFTIKINDGKCFWPKKTGFNHLYFDITEKYKKEFMEMAVLYKKIKPSLWQIKELDNQKIIISGNSLYELYIREDKFDKNLEQFIKRNKANIEAIKEKIYDKTGWYYLGNDTFGLVDVDRNLIKGVSFKNKWVTTSMDRVKIKEESNFITTNIGLLNDYKLEKSMLYDKLKEKENIALEIKKEINLRNDMIEELKKDITPLENKKQKII